MVNFLLFIIIFIIILLELLLLFLNWCLFLINRLWRDLYLHILLRLKKLLSLILFITLLFGFRLTSWSESRILILKDLFARIDRSEFCMLHFGIVKVMLLNIYIKILRNLIRHDLCDFWSNFPIFRFGRWWNIYLGIWWL